MFKGETLVYSHQALNPDGTVMNLTGATIIWTAKNQYSEPDSAAVSQLRSPSSGVLITNANIGQFTATMPPLATYALPGDAPITLYWDAKVIAANGQQHVVDSGTLTVNPAVTRAIV